ncbi:MAG: hypothetical protein MW690_001099 [Methanophagales archaeon]|nr:hypothetical protein [Methanophagales archaeon]
MVVSPLLFQAAFISAPKGLHPRGRSFHPRPCDLILSESSHTQGSVSFLRRCQGSRPVPFGTRVLAVGGLSSAPLHAPAGARRNRQPPSISPPLSIIEQKLISFSPLPAPHTLRTRSLRACSAPLSGRKELYL